ncbi:MAG: P-loop NTPase [Planctomycetes bacterium]|nr:P-loop NTPase [Planctomycetota bacterium]
MTSAPIGPTSGPGPGLDQAARLRELFRRHPAEARDAGQPKTPILAITSGKGGVGKTNIAVNLAAVLAQDYRVTLVDADLGMANADILCGVSPTRRLQHAMPMSDGTVHGRMGAHTCAGADLSSIGIPTPYGFTLVPGAVGVSRMADLGPAEQTQLIRGLSHLEARSQVVLLDTGAGISSGVRRFLAVADAVLVVATPEPTSIADAYALIKCLSQTDTCGRAAGSRLCLVVNQARSREDAERVHGRIARVCREFLSLDLPFLGWVPRDAQVQESVMSQGPVTKLAPRAPASQAIVELSKSLSRKYLIANEPAGKPVPGVGGPKFGMLRRLLSGR